MTRQRSVSDFLYSLSITCGAAALFGLGWHVLPEPWSAGLAFAAAFMGGRWAQEVYPL